MTRALIVTCLLSLLVACSQPAKNTKISITLTPWVGYYPLYYAMEKGIAKELGVDLRIVETMSVADFRRAAVKAHIDGFACSLTELTQLNQILDEPLNVVAYPDYSNGGDVIVASKSIETLDDLIGKSIGFEWQALGHFVITLAFKNASLDSSRIQHVNVEQIGAAQKFENGDIDAYVTYPPISTNLLKAQNLHVVFDSSEIPFQIMDALVVKSASGIEKVKLLEDVWAAAMNNIKNDPQPFVNFVAKQLGTNAASAEAELKGVKLLGEKDQQELSKNPEQIEALYNLACTTTDKNVEKCQNKLRNISHFGQSINTI